MCDNEYSLKQNKSIQSLIQAQSQLIFKNENYVKVSVEPDVNIQTNNEKSLQNFSNIHNLRLRLQQ